ncbi:MAG: hypothetical protein DRI44_04035 [Chlamydiae bacterium]|nr:MAG: hypothetical protein DRI44_04035 [Chlamydiota bacterium]
MKNIILFLACIGLLCSCASTKPSGKVTQQDLNMFKKTFEGTLLSKKFVPYSRKDSVIGIPFWTKPVTANYLKLTVMDENGKIREFYDYSEDNNRKAELKQYNNELNKGDLVIIDMGFIDEGNSEELFDSVTKK